MSAAAPTLGERLKAERERKGLSTQKAADHLHLDAWAIEALESGDYARIGPAVYGKGHLKRYAALLGLPADEVLAAYEPNVRAPAAPSGQAPSLRMAAADPLGRTIPWAPAGGLALALVIAGVVWWRPWQSPRSLPATSGLSMGAGNTAPAAVTAAAPQTAAPAPIATAVPTSGPPAAPGPVPQPAPPPLRATVALPVPPPPPPPAARPLAAAARRAADASPGVGRARLRLSFSADSWVDVHDAAGIRLFAGNGRANSVRTVAGAAPMTVYLGFAGGVQLEVNNHAVAIGPQFLAGDAARFVAGADGVLRRDPHAAAAGQPHPRG
jgi:cytoskeleton protein RodZ